MWLSHECHVAKDLPEIWVHRKRSMNFTFYRWGSTAILNLRSFLLLKRRNYYLLGAAEGLLYTQTLDRSIFDWLVRVRPSHN